MPRWGCVGQGTTEVTSRISTSTRLSVSLMEGEGPGWDPLECEFSGGEGEGPRGGPRGGTRGRARDGTHWSVSGVSVEALTGPGKPLTHARTHTHTHTHTHAHTHTHTHSKAHLAPYLPSHPITHVDGIQYDKSLGTVSSAAWGSAAILPISWAYIKMMGPKGLKRASEVSE